jgi:tRNA (guanine37-N1)-methyltransferase
MQFDVLSLFPGIFQGYLGQSLLKRAIDNRLVDVRLHNIRDWANDKHNCVDDRPFGGGPGMVLKVEPIVDCVEAVQGMGQQPGHLIMLTPQGKPLEQVTVERLAKRPRLLLLCGRYEGFDERIRTVLKPEEISLGDFILNGGEVAAMAVIDAVMRLVPGTLGDEDSSVEDSFSGETRLLEFAQYTRPREYRDLEVPDVLLSGNHQKIAQWREDNSRQRTRSRRADLLEDEKQ